MTPSHDFVWPNGRCSGEGCDDPMVDRRTTTRTRALHHEYLRRQTARARFHPSMTSTRLDAVVGFLCVAFACIATLGWVVPALIRFAAGGRIE